MEKIISTILIILVYHSQGQDIPLFGFSQNNRQNVGGIVNSFLGGIFGSNQGRNCRRNNGGCAHICDRGQCFCDGGYTLARDGFSCIDTDECSLPQLNICADICTNTPGSFVCGCTGGQSLQPDGYSCSFGPDPSGPPSVERSCRVNNGGCEQKCKDRKGFVRCKCYKGYRPASDGVSCLDIDECADPSFCPGACTNTPGSYICGNLAGASCDVDNGGCEHKCRRDRKGNGHIKCQCDRGYNLAPDGKSCTAKGKKNPCDRNNGGCQHNCRVENDHKVCSCNQGYTLENNKKCKPIQGQVDPCAAVRCHHKCENVNGRPSCVCHPGYSLINGICELNQPISAPQQDHCSNKQSTLPSGCGSSLKDATIPRIVGGRLTNPTDWPWMVGLMAKGANATFCGAVLIKPQFILTAAHCCIVYKANEITARVGEHDFSRTDDNCPEDHDVLQIIMHEGYNRVTNQNDIALLKIASPVKYNAFIQPVCLPLPSHDPIGKYGYIVGWGTTSFLGMTSSQQREATIPSWETKDCENAYSGRIYEGMMCAGSYDGKRDSCQGDSGGPLLQFSGGRWHVAGIVSWGEECATVNKPGVYTQVNKYLPWIFTNIRRK